MEDKATLGLFPGQRNTPFECMLGSWMRKKKHVTKEVLSMADRYQKVDANLQVKKMMRSDRLYVVYLKTLGLHGLLVDDNKTICHVEKPGKDIIVHPCLDLLVLRSPSSLARIASQPAVP